MSMIRTFSSAFTTVLLLAACDQAESEAASMSSFRAETPSDEQLLIDYCPANRQIAVKDPEFACPSVTGWQAAALFAGAPQGSALANYCVYTASSSTSDVKLLQQRDELLRVAPDCGVVFEQNDDAVWVAAQTELELAFEHGIGRASATDLGLSTPDPRSAVAVAVVDSVPEGATQPRSIHGDLMVGLVRDIACPAGSTGCKVTVRRALGLPLYIDGNGNAVLDLVNGGTFGTQAQLAQAIYQSVEAWKAWNDDAKLIINLSVAWEPEPFGGGSTTNSRPSTEAVYSAMEYANCYKGIIVAAAGNMGYSCKDGLKLPAAWYDHVGPDAQRCGALLGSNGPSPAPSATNQQLVYAIGGLSHLREGMTGSRLQGIPNLAALATNAPVNGDGTTVTGSSAAAAVASGAAALVWSYNDGLTGAEIMDFLYDAGNPTSVDTAFVAPNTTAVRAINACKALQAACDHTTTCPFTGTLPCLNAAAPVEPEDVLVALSSANPTVYQPTSVSAQPCDLECGSFTASVVQGDAAASSSCPEGFSMTRPYTLPQPTEIACPNCTLDPPEFKVYASIDPSYGSYPVEEVVIAVLDSTNHTTYFRYSDLTLDPTTLSEIKLDSSELPNGVNTIIRSGSISIHFQGWGVVTDPLLTGAQ
jgi:hypothetical protein